MKRNINIGLIGGVILLSLFFLVYFFKSEPVSTMKELIPVQLNTKAEPTFDLPVKPSEPATTETATSSAINEVTPKPATGTDSLPADKPTDLPSVEQPKIVTPEPAPAVSSLTWSMKLIPADLNNQELKTLQEKGFTILSYEWGMADLTPPELLELLDRIDQYHLKLIVNLSEEAAWGYTGESFTATTPPRWQAERVQEYVQAIKNHPAIYGYDISNEAGENLPNGQDYRISLEQLKIASAQVRSLDPGRPIIMRMHYWDEEDEENLGLFGKSNPFAAGIADVVMLNLYSNWVDAAGGKTAPYMPEMVAVAGQELTDKVKAVDPKVKVWIALGAFADSPEFTRPSAEALAFDIKAALKIKGISNIGFFGWGAPSTRGGVNWYLPSDGPDLLEVMGQYTKL